MADRAQVHQEGRGRHQHVHIHGVAEHCASVGADPGAPGQKAVPV